MGRIKVLVTDDSAVVRRIVQDALAADPEIEVVGTAGNGRIALERIEALGPDVVTLDVEMPEMDGLAALKELHRRRPRLPVIMFSTLTSRGAAATIEALASGAVDYVTKPVSPSGIAAAKEAIQRELIPKIKAIVRRRADPPAGRREAPARVASRPVPAASRVDVVAIGCSTGGPSALAEIIPRLPGGFPVPILVVQHMPPMFTALLAQRLDRGSSLRVAEARDGEEVGPDRVYVAPGDHHMVVGRQGARMVIGLNQGERENSCRPAVDPLFRSVAAAFGSHALGVVLTGMGRDGCDGAAALSRGGAEIIVQDEASSVVWGMPGAVAGEGLASAVLPLSGVASEITMRVRHGRTAAAPPPRPGVPAPVPRP